VNKASGKSVKQSRATEKASGPIRWDEIPHNELWARALEAMSFGSCSRATEDSLKHVLKRRLHRLDPADHLRYVELECARIVETLRMVRDEYRSYLKDRGCAPLAEMYWVVLRYGVKDWAVMLLRTAAFEYIRHCKLQAELWDGLFKFAGPFKIFLPDQGESTPTPSIVKSDDALIRAFNVLLPPEVFDQVLTGGPFGRDAQLHVARVFPGQAALHGQETFPDAVRRRQALWDDGYPWTEGLAQMFDATQEELFSQLEALGGDARRAEARFIRLSSLQKIAHKHLVSIQSGDIADQTTGSNRWLSLLRELDAEGISLDHELQGKAREVLVTLRRKGSKIATWEECYNSKATVTLDDGKRYRLRREVTRLIHNAVKKAVYHLGKIWRQKGQS
jgi:hypothetical protein